MRTVPSTRTKAGRGIKGERELSQGQARRTGFAKARPDAYLGQMFKSFDFCLLTKSTSAPAGPDWLHE